MALSAIDEAKKLYGQVTGGIQGAVNTIKTTAPIPYVASKIAPKAQSTFNYLGQQVGNAIKGPISPIPQTGSIQTARNIAGTTAQSVIQDIPTVGASMLRASPPVQFGKQLQGLSQPQQQPKITQQRISDVYHGMRGAGYVAAPVQNVLGGIVGTGFGAVDNVLNKRPVFQNIDKNFAQGVKDSAQFSALGVINPLFRKELSGKPLAGIGRSFTGEVGKRMLMAGTRNAIENGVMGLLQPDTQNRIKNAQDQAIFGLVLGAFSQGTGDIGSAAINRLAKQSGVGVDTVKSWVKHLNVPVATTDVDPRTGKRIVKPLWQTYLGSNQGGFIDFSAEVVNPLKKATKKTPITLPPRKTTLTEGLELPGGSSSNIPEIPSSPGSISQKVENPTDPYFNVNRLNVSPETRQVVKTTVEQARPQIEKIVGKTLSNDEVRKTADVTAKVLNSTVSREQTLAWEAAMLKARQGLAAMAQNGTLTKDELDGMLAIKTQGEDIARKLQSLSIDADPQTVTAKQVIMDAIFKVTKNADDILKASEGVDFNDPKQATDFYRKFVKPTAGEWMDTLRYNSMLSSPNTWISNISSNYQGTGIVTPIEKTITGAIDFLSSKVTGKKQNYLAGEGAAYAVGYYSNLGKATQRLWKSLKGETLSSFPDTRDMPLGTGKIGKTVEAVLKPPQRILEGWDQFFSALTEGGLEKAGKYRLSQGFDDTTGKQIVKETEKRLFRAKLGDKGEGALLQAIDTIPNLIQNAKNSNKPLVSTIAKLTFPFIRTPVNVFKQGIEYSPAGVLTIPGAKEKLPQFTKALMGATVALGAAQLATSGRLTFGKPQSKEQQQLWDKAGMQPYAVKIGNNWVSYSKLHPVIGFNFAAVAAVNEALEKSKLSDEQADTILQGVSNILMFYADQSYMKSVGDMVNAASQGTSGIPKLASNYWQQYVPYRAFSGWLARITDNFDREVGQDASKIEKQMQYFMMQIPGLRQQLPTKSGPTGEPLQQNNRLLNAVSPARVTEGNKVYEDAYRLKSGEAKLKDAKNEAIRYYLGGNTEKAKEVKQQYNVEVKQDDLKQYQTTQKKKALDAYIKGDIEEANRIKKETGVYITKNEVAGAAKREAIKLYKLGLKEDARKLKEKYGFQVSTKDLKEAGYVGLKSELKVTTREADKFPFPDYSESSPGQKLRADLNFEGSGDADIVLYFRSPDGKVTGIPQTKETFSGGKNYYGLELDIPKSTPIGNGEIWVTVNGKEVTGTRRSHKIVNGNPTSRYESFSR